MKEYLIVDGYNVINAWKEFASLREESLEHARDLLVAGIAEYTAFKGYHGIVVFDAQEVQGDGSVVKIHGVEVVFTNEGEQQIRGLNAEAMSLVRKDAKCLSLPAIMLNRLTSWEPEPIVFQPGSFTKILRTQKKKLQISCIIPDVL